MFEETVGWSWGDGKNRNQEVERIRALLSRWVAEAYKVKYEWLSLMSDMVLLVPKADQTNLRQSPVIPLRHIRVLHVAGFCTNIFYESLPCIYGELCVNSVQSQQRFRHTLAFVYPDGNWSFPENYSEKAMRDASRMGLLKAMTKIESIIADIMPPHMFSYLGLTAYRSV